MDPKNELSVPKWPFFLADGFFVAAAGLTLWFASAPVSPGAVLAVVILLLVGAVLSLLPYLVEFYWNLQQAEADTRERTEAQRQALAKTGADVADVVRRLEAVGSRPENPDDEGMQAVRELQEAIRGLCQWQEQWREKQGEFEARIDRLLREEEDRRQEFHGELQRVEERVGNADASPDLAAENGGNGNHADETDPAGSAALAEEPEESVGEPVLETVPADGDVEPTPVAPRRKSSKSKKVQVQQEAEGSLFSTTTLVVTAFIGASNKLFLRGEGPGLSWDEGVPMQFVEIGKWSWTTTEATEPFRVHIYKNDSEADKTGVLDAEPGQRLDVRPEF